MKKKMIVHFLPESGFSAGYINFMKLCIPEFEHHFFVPDSLKFVKINSWSLYNNENVYYYRNLISTLLRSEYRRILKRCNMIINSGVYHSPMIKAFMIASGIIHKTYIQFWEDSFSYYAESTNSILHPRRFMGKLLTTIFLERSAGTINLIDGDREILKRAFPNLSRYFVAQMPADPLEIHNFTAIIRANDKHVEGGVHKLLVGHSAFDSGRHIDAFRILEHLKDENIEIICPLSYGNPEYRDEVIKAGKNIFGSKFTPITDLMSKDDYINFLAQCDAGIYATRTQQAMGNIHLLLRLGKKVYIREDNPMWPHFTDNLEFSVYPFSQLEGITLEQLINFPQETAYNNIRVAEELEAPTQAVEQWRKVFAD